MNTQDKPKAIVIGSGFGGISAAIRLQALGVQTTILEKLEQPGGRGRVHEAEGFKFDMGPTVITVPHFLEELFSLQTGDHNQFDPAKNFPEPVSQEYTSKYVTLKPILPFYRIYFSDGTYFDYDGDRDHTIEQIKAIDPDDVAGFERFERDAKLAFERGFKELGYTYFGDPWTMLKVVPDLLKLNVVRSLFSYVSKYFKSDKIRQVFSFESLLIGGNPLKVPAIYVLVHGVEKAWKIHYCMGGTGALVRALVKKFEELGGAIRYNSPVEQIFLDENKKARAVRIVGGHELECDLVISNADYAHTYSKLIDPKARFWNADWKIKAMSYSMSLMVIYFGFKKDDQPLDLQHHNIILGKRYEGLLKDIFERKVLSADYSQYLHIPTLTDPSMAPDGYHTAYTLIPVPNKRGNDIDWKTEGPKLSAKVLQELEQNGFIPNLASRLKYIHFITPDYFESELNAFAGNAFGVQPIFRQTAFFRPHNRSEDIANLYLVGASTMPGAGVPSVMMSAKITTKLIADDFKI